MADAASPGWTAVRAIAPRGLLPLTKVPLNAETPLEALASPTTPIEDVFIRNHFGVPRLRPKTWRLVVDGNLRRPCTLSLADVQALPNVRMTVTLECAGNGRMALHAPPPGVPWRMGAVSIVEVKGTPLAGVLLEAGPRPSTREILCVGSDRGRIDGVSTAFERSVPLDVALSADVLLVWEMNGRPLMPEHGAPLRLVVPGWYAMASVKWLVHLAAIAEPFGGHYQKEEYVYRRIGAPDEPVTSIRVRSLFAYPLDGAEIRAPIKLLGPAWSGRAPVRRVEVTMNRGEAWRPARLIRGSSRYAPARWQLAWTPPGPGDFVLGVRAEDDSGDRQPDEPFSNALGYGNNVVHWIRVRVRM